MDQLRQLIFDPARPDYWTVRLQPTDAVTLQPRDINVDAAVRSAHAAWENGWRDLAPGKRGQILYQVARVLREHVDELGQLEQLQIGKPIADARDEAGLGARVFEYYAGAITKFGGQTLPVSRGGLDFTLRQPLGVVAASVLYVAAPALARVFGGDDDRAASLGCPLQPRLRICLDLHLGTESRSTGERGESIRRERSHVADAGADHLRGTKRRRRCEGGAQLRHRLVGHHCKEQRGRRSGCTVGVATWRWVHAKAHASVSTWCVASSFVPSHSSMPCAWRRRVRSRSSSPESTIASIARPSQ